MRMRFTPDRFFVLIPLVAVLASLGAGLMLLFPKQPATISAAEQKKRENKIVEDAAKAARRAEQLADEVGLLTWKEQPDQIEPKALEIVNRSANRSNVKVLGFRPQKATSAGGLEQLPFLVTLEGAFPNVVALVRDLGTRSNRLAVTTVQVASADAASDKVTATVVLAAFRLPDGGSTK